MMGTRGVPAKYGGFGGGHARASGAKVPKEKLDAFIGDIAKALNGL